MQIKLFFELSKTKNAHLKEKSEFLTLELLLKATLLAGLLFQLGSIPSIIPLDISKLPCLLWDVLRGKERGGARLMVRGSCAGDE